ncbi:hypothetical protein [Vibrio sp. MA40-2]|uniref:hypothetical protein n=1 Tax=Vibrio sp. MA40-2 TaxID=3391828 RepID=UPI0039A55C1F
MKKLLLPITLALLAGCSSSEYAESMPNPNKTVVYERVDISQELNASYCEMTGFKRFHESDKYYTFECKDGSKFRVPK